VTTGTSRARSRVTLWWMLPALLLAAAAWGLIAAFYTVDVTEYGLVVRFGRVVRVVAEPGLHVTAPFDRIVRLDKRVLFLRPARSEYLTTDKKNIVGESLATWRIADPERFLAAFATRSAAEERLSDIVLSEIGSVIGRYPAAALVSTDPAESRYRAVLSEIGRRVADFTRPAYGIDVLSIALLRLSLPEQNREHVFDRMRAERARIAKENRSAGELQAKKIIAEADHEKTRIDAEAAGQAERIRAEGDAQASRRYAAAFGLDPKLYEFIRTLRAYDRILDDKTTLFLPADVDLLRMLHFDAQPAHLEPPPRAPVHEGVADLPLLNKPGEGSR
jgi:modulator of FtsH protease HflC